MRVRKHENRRAIRGQLKLRVVRPRMWRTRVEAGSGFVVEQQNQAAKNRNSPHHGQTEVGKPKVPEKIGA